MNDEVVLLEWQQGKWFGKWAAFNKTNPIRTTFI